MDDEGAVNRFAEKAKEDDGFWKCMDTLRDKEELDYLWTTNQAKWKKWE